MKRRSEARVVGAGNAGQSRRMAPEYVIRGIAVALDRAAAAAEGGSERGGGGGSPLCGGTRVGEGNEPRQLISPGFHNALANERPL